MLTKKRIRMRRVLRGFVAQPLPPKRRLLELTLVRHGQSEGNLAYRRAGQGDDSLYSGGFMDRHSSLWRLTDRGRMESRAAGEWLQEECKAFDAHYTSEFLRAMETSALLNIKNAQWYAEPNCRERDWGAWDLARTKERDSKEESRRRRAGLYFAPAGGESLAAVILRVDLLLDYLHGRYPDRRVLMVCHGELMWAFRLRFEKLNQIQFREMGAAARGDERIHNGSVLRYSREDPSTGEAAKSFRWMQLATPGHVDQEKRRPGWREFRPMSYSNEDLLELVGRFPNIYCSSLDEPGQLPRSVLPDALDDESVLPDAGDTGWPGERG